jgi:prophage antirepressor-like protein
MTTQAQGAPAPAVFDFEPSYSVRMVMIQGDPWFVAKDVNGVPEKSSRRNTQSFPIQR